MRSDWKRGGAGDVTWTMSKLDDEHFEDKSILHHLGMSRDFKSKH
jgi:hypothetical protein